MVQDREPKSFKCVCRGKTIQGTAQYCGYNFRDYWVQFTLGGIQYSFTMVMTGLGAKPLYTVNRFFAGNKPDEAVPLDGLTKMSDAAIFEATLDRIVAQVIL